MKKLLIFSLIFSLFLTGCTNPTSGGSETTDTSEIIESTETDITTDVTEAPVIENVDYKSNFNKNSHLFFIKSDTKSNYEKENFTQIDFLFICNFFNFCSRNKSISNRHNSKRHKQG